ncbi:hypothetical protein [Pyrobaculum aerophilum]|uniref:hypothetical protein n=1 Tax=Pyrobaculum aerophilum TaxID=13773 RepID=UPI0023F0C25C|nr:hypothetical protein [Pyrobaculum aerophilum]MCX8136611.1 hypothetical protein [Pyrobaculum aerophilum]
MRSNISVGWRVNTTSLSQDGGVGLGVGDGEVVVGVGVVAVGGVEAGGCGGGDVALGVVGEGVEVVDGDGFAGGRAAKYIATRAITTATAMPTRVAVRMNNFQHLFKSLRRGRINHIN